MKTSHQCSINTSCKPRLFGAYQFVVSRPTPPSPDSFAAPIGELVGATGPDGAACVGHRLGFPSADGAKNKHKMALSGERRRRFLLSGLIVCRMLLAPAYRQRRLSPWSRHAKTKRTKQNPILLIANVYAARGRNTPEPKKESKKTTIKNKLHQVKGPYMTYGLAPSRRSFQRSFTPIR